VKSISIELKGKHSRRGDSDNVAGSVLDALVQAGVLAGDNLKVVSKLAIALEYSKDSPTACILIDL
jgi:Holliday junction resolvase RusA-like endonuclease